MQDGQRRDMAHALAAIQNFVEVFTAGCKQGRRYFDIHGKPLRTPMEAYEAYDRDGRIRIEPPDPE